MVKRWARWCARWWQDLRRWDARRGEFNTLAVKLGYGGRDYLEAAIEIAQRCVEAETQALEAEGQLLHGRRVLQNQVEALQARVAYLERELAAQEPRGAGELPGLSPAEIERLALLAEECGEVVQAAAKVLRFGWASASPFGGATNQVALEREIGNVRAAVTLMLDAHDLRLGDLQDWQRRKRGALEKWTLHQDCSMPRDEQLEMIAAIRRGQ